MYATKAWYEEEHVWLWCHIHHTSNQDEERMLMRFATVRVWRLFRSSWAPLGWQVSWRLPRMLLPSIRWPLMEHPNERRGRCGGSVCASTQPNSLMHACEMHSLLQSLLGNVHRTFFPRKVTLNDPTRGRRSKAMCFFHGEDGSRFAIWTTCRPMTNPITSFIIV